MQTSVLLYADGMVLMSNDRGELATMLQAMDRGTGYLLVCRLHIKASKTEIMAIKLNLKKGSVEVDQEAEELVLGRGGGGCEGGITVQVPVCLAVST